jgi:prolyl 4-hydroxylase
MLDIQTRCPPLEDVDPVFHPGDLNKMFERIVRTAPANRTLNDKEKEPLESGMTDYAVVVHSQPSSEAATEVSAVLDSSLPPWVITLENFLTPEECDAMIELGYKYGYERSEDVGALKFDGTHEGVQNDRRTSENAWCSTFQGCRQQEIPMLIHERMAKVMQIPVNNSEDLQVLRYEEGQFYRTHHDYIQHHAERHCGVRILTFFLYLSDVEAGGGTNFPQLDMTIHPKKGRALLWPSVLDSDPSKIDKRMYHQALPVEEGVKYAANGWIHPFDYVTPQAAGCN